MAGCACKGGKKQGLNEEHKAILEVIAKSEEPCAGKEVAAALGMEAKSVSCKITALKKKGFVDSPVRCKYGVTAEGHEALKNC